MKIFIPKLFFLIALISCQTTAKIVKLQNQLQLEQIAPLTYIVTDTNYFWANTLVTKMKDDTVVIVSSPYENVGTTSLMNWIKTDLKPKKIIAINTHFHSDGTGGNEVFKQEGVEIWSSDLTKLLTETELGKVKTEGLPYIKSEELKKRILNSKNMSADHIFKLSDGKNFEFGGEKITIFFPGHAHSPDNLAVYFDARKILFGGCIIKPKGDLGYLRDANVSNWARATKRMLDLNPEIVVPGHGQWGGSNLLLKTIEIAKKQGSLPL